MTVDKNLFLHDLAVVAIIKNEGAYLKEWLDYHLLAGVDHFYLFDNDSPDNQAEVAAPYVEAGLVDYIPAPGKLMQYAVYNEAVKRFRFQCRYMAFIDADEFIFPKTNQSIVEVVDEVLSRNPNAAGLALNFQTFGSNGHETADLTRGVLERFTRRAFVNWIALINNTFIAGNFYCKCIVNPRLVSVIASAHLIDCFGGLHCVNSDGVIYYEAAGKRIVAANKIVVNHYNTKSREEFISRRLGNSTACWEENPYGMEHFLLNDRNEEFDDGILRYRAARAENFSLEGDETKFKRVIETLTEILSAFASGKNFSLETALTCRALSNRFGLKMHEEAALAAILNSLEGLSLVDGYLLIRELPKLLRLPYPAAKSLREVAFQLVEQFTVLARMNEDWQFYVELIYLQEFFKE